MNFPYNSCNYLPTDNKLVSRSEAVGTQIVPISVCFTIQNYTVL